MMTKAIPARFSKDSIIDTSKVKPAIQEAKKPSSVVETEKKVRKAKQEGDQNYLSIGSYKIHARQKSGYRVVYRVLSEICNFVRGVEALKDFREGVTDLNFMFVEVQTAENAVREDSEWKEYAAERLASMEGKKNSRVLNGEWKGNIREMFSVCCGSSSSNCSNKNIKKYTDSGLMFHMFKRENKNYITMFPAEYKERVFMAIK